MILDLPVTSRLDRPSNSIKTSRYTAANFLFKCTSEQFRNLSNVYFLVIIFLAVLGTYTKLFESPFAYAGTLSGLVLVVGFTMAFEGYYDFKRHHEDKEINNRRTWRLRPGDGHVEEISWENVHPGDLLKIYDRTQFPADLLFVTSCNASNGSKCYVETANIDGETNLKIKNVHKAMLERCLMPDQAASIHSRLVYEMPNAQVSFSGYMRLFDEEHSSEPTPEGYMDIPLDASHVLLRGCVLRNTPWILGIVLYAGPETTAVQSSKDPPSKRSRLQKLMNRMILFILFVGAIMCVASSLFEIYLYPSNTMLTYLQQPENNVFIIPLFLSNFLTFVVLYSSLVPISLLFCVTITNFFQALFITWDDEMYDEESNSNAKCNTIELVQELGQVSYLFSDKTGTLTKNEMKLVGCSVGGETFGIGKSEENVSLDSTPREIFAKFIAKAQDDQNDFTRQRIHDFLMILGVCSTVVVDSVSGYLQYNAEGPDEEAFVNAAADIGYRLFNTDYGVFRINIDFSDEAYNSWISRCDESEETIDPADSHTDTIPFKGTNFEISSDFEILAINRFNTTRKRMSVVCRAPDGRIMLLAKGADTMMFNITRSLSPEEARERTILNGHLDLFANDGLRTLVFAKKEISIEDFEPWKRQYDEASTLVGDHRTKALEDAAYEIEVGLEIVGATAILDRLQEGVPETLVSLREAGVKTWVLTGDKVDTAINIGFSARLFSPETHLVKVIDDDEDSNIKTLQSLLDLIVPKHVAKNSEKRKEGRKNREALKQKKHDDFQHAAPNKNHFGNSVGRAVHQMERGMGNAVRKTTKSVVKFGKSIAHIQDHQDHQFDPVETDQKIDSHFKNVELNLGDSKFAMEINDEYVVDMEGNDEYDGRNRLLRGSEEQWCSPLESSLGHQDDNDLSFDKWTMPKVRLPTGVDEHDLNIYEREIEVIDESPEGFEAENLALVISGSALLGLLSEEKGSKESEALLLAVARMCSVVMACRVSPIQKALLVRMVKNGIRMHDNSAPVTLAIGDGANDVAMIQEARVGVGISGHEGRQAVNSSDFAIAQFRFLQDLMLVHGRWNYRRSSTIVLFVFYVSIVFVLTSFVFNFFNKYSGSALYFSFLVVLYAYPTQIPICFVETMNKDISRKTAIEYPAMYISGRRNLNFNSSSIYGYVIRAAVHSFVISAICIIWGSLESLDIATIGTTTYLACVWVCVTRACLETYTWTWISACAVLLGYSLVLIAEPIYYSGDSSIYVQFGNTIIFNASEAPRLWASVFVCAALCSIFDVIASVCRKQFNPTLVDIVVEIDRRNEEGQEKRQLMIGVNKFFRRIAQPLIIPAVAISELLASTSIKGVVGTGGRSAFDFESPQEARYMQNAVARILFSKYLIPQFRVKQCSESLSTSIRGRAAPIRISLAMPRKTSLTLVDSHLYEPPYPQSIDELNENELNEPKIE